MKIWLTPPYADEGLTEVETVGEPNGDVFTYTENGFQHTAVNWFREGSTWHRTKDAAAEAATRFRYKRIAAATAEVARLAALPPIPLTPRAGA